MKRRMEPCGLKRGNLEGLASFDRFRFVKADV